MGRSKRYPADHWLEFLSDNSSTYIAAGTRGALRMDLSNEATVLVQLPAAFEYFNKEQPHSLLKMHSPREFWRHQAAQACQSSLNDVAERCK